MILKRWLIALPLILVSADGCDKVATHTNYRLVVDDTIEVGQGQLNDTLTVAANDSTTVLLPLDLSWKALTRAGGGALAAGEVNYMVTGKITLATPLGPHDVPLNVRGRFAPLRPIT